MMIALNFHLTMQDKFVCTCDF